MIFLIIFLFIIIAFIISFFYKNLNYYKKPMKKVKRSEYKELQAVLPDSSVINYAHCGKGTPLLLIHGQGVAWQDYAEVLPELSKHYHVYAVDCFGHGKSSHNSEKYSAQETGKALSWFIENVIKEPAIVSGHSSGGLLTVWLAANSPENVKGIILEDPPLFSCEIERTEKTFAFVDSFEPIHRYINQNEEKNYSLFYLKNCKWLDFFGKSKEKILNYGIKYNLKHPESEIKFFFLPPAITRMFHFLREYDPIFGEAFYTCSWMKNFSHKENLLKINCPSVLIHTRWSYSEEGILLGAMDEKDAQKAVSYIKNCKLINVKSGHDFHAEKPKEFLNIIINGINNF